MRCILRTILFSYLFLVSSHAFAGFSPGSEIFLYGTGNSGMNGIVAFSVDPVTRWVAPILPTKFNAPSYSLSGNVWIDAIGWSTFDHGVAGFEARIDDPSCISNASLRVCSLTGFLWSANIGWIRISGGNGNLGVEYSKDILSLSGSAWSNQVGWIDMTGIRSIIGPISLIVPGGVSLPSESYQTTTTGSTIFQLDIDPLVLPLLAGTDLEICIPPNTHCTSYPLDISDGSIVGIDLSIATDYDYTLTDPNGSTTNGTISVISGPISFASPLGGTYNSADGRLKSYCTSFPGDATRCPDGASISPTTLVGDFTNISPTPTGKYANYADTYTTTFSLRDPYGNMVKSVPGIKQVDLEVDLTSNVTYNTVPHNYQYSGGLAITSGNAITAYNSTPVHSDLPLGDFSLSSIITDESINLRSFAPTSTGHSINIEGVLVTVSPLLPILGGVGEGTFSLTDIIYTGAITFEPLVAVTSFEGLADVQMGRLQTLTGTISFFDTPTQVHVIHALTIGSDTTPTISSFQDFSNEGSPDCSAFSTGVINPLYVSYCSRGVHDLAIHFPSTVISYLVNGATTHSFTLMPRRIEEVTLSQDASYDSIVSLTFGGKSIVYPSLSINKTDTNKSIFANAVKVIGQRSGNAIFQSITTLDQSKNANLSRIEYVNMIRRNIGILIRNATFVNDEYTGTGNAIKVYKKDVELSPATLFNNGIRSIVTYGDITITGDYTLPGISNTPMALVALKKDDGTGGNIYIRNDVKRIDATLVTQGSLFSGEKGPPVRYYAQEASATGTLENQLYVFGSIISLNTIGGSSLPDGTRCPTSFDGCNDTNALIYDFEHMRYYRGGGAEAAMLARNAAALSSPDNESPFIIEYNQNIAANPPPGLK